MLNPSKLQFFRFVGAWDDAMVGTICATSPMLVYKVSTLILSRFMAGVAPIWPSEADRYLCIIALCQMPLLTIDAWRAARAFAGREYPATMSLAYTSLAAAPAWLPLAEVEFGPFVYVAILIWWPIASLSAVAFVVAAAQIDAETRGEEVRLTALTTLYHLGGFLGVALAKRHFPQSKAVEQFPSGAPRGVAFIAVALVALALTKTAPVPSVPPWGLSHSGGYGLDSSGRATVPLPGAQMPSGAVVAARWTDHWSTPELSTPHTGQCDSPPALAGRDVANRGAACGCAVQAVGSRRRHCPKFFPHHRGPS